MQARESVNPQTLEEMVSELFPKQFSNLATVPTTLADVDQTTLQQLLGEIPVETLKEHFKLTARCAFTNALLARHIKLSDCHLQRLNAIPKTIFPRLMLASRNIDHLAEALNVQDKWLGTYLKQQFLELFTTKARNTAYATVKCHLLAEAGLLDTILETHVALFGANESCLEKIAETIGCNQSDTYHFVIKYPYWQELAKGPKPAAADTTFLTYVRQAEPKVEHDISPSFPRTQLDEEFPLFGGELESVSKSTSEANPTTDDTSKEDAIDLKCQTWIEQIANKFHFSLQKVKDCLAASTTGGDFRSRLGKHLEYDLEHFFTSNNISYFELKTGKEINSIRAMIVDLYQYENGELKLKNSIAKFVAGLGVTEGTLFDYLKQHDNTSVARIMMEDLTPSCLFAIIKTAKGNKAKISLDTIARIFVTRSEHFQTAIKFYFGLSLVDLANNLLPAIGNENFELISEKYTKRIGEMTQEERYALSHELQRLAAKAPTVSLFSQERPQIEDFTPRKAPRIPTPILR